MSDIVSTSDSDLAKRLDKIEERLDRISVAVNQIGEMMSAASDAINNLFAQVQSGGIFKMLGAMKGGN